MPLFGCARVSTFEQDLWIQEAALRAARCQAFRSEKKSGTECGSRTELQIPLDFLREGDALVVTRIDRLVRSMKDLQEIVYEMKNWGVALKATEQPVDAGTETCKAFLDMLGVFAKFETNLRRVRQTEGIEAAKARAVYKGRKARIDPEAVRKLAAGGMKPVHIARQLGISRGTVHRFIPNRGMPEHHSGPSDFGFSWMENGPSALESRRSIAPIRLLRTRQGVRIYDVDDRGI